MHRLRAFAALLTVAAALVAGCGGGFADSYQPVDRELHGVGVALEAALRNANHQTNMQFAATLRGVEHRLADVRAKLARLGSPPDEIKAQYAALRAELRKVDDDMLSLATHVAVNDVPGTKVAARTLIEDAAATSPKVQAIRRKLGLPPPK